MIIALSSLEIVGVYYDCWKNAPHRLITLLISTRVLHFRFKAIDGSCWGFQGASVRWQVRDARSINRIVEFWSLRVTVQSFTLVGGMARSY